ncbi:thiopurine S-methyltransferase [Pseudomonas sp. RL_15y_Pfl2_60]|uniref:thiopurine S-methyltransferase n=1 Tax=Pseudomonas sp. RL_15y_Pfl2_60 TaxID=3088709 RepID=UPI0030D8E3E9
MQADFWQARWENNEIGFHAKQINSYLQANWSALGLQAGDQVFVPLCGKSLDLTWLAAQGLRVTGVELSQIAVEAFFAEQQLEPSITEEGVFKVYRAGSIEIYCGDFFEFDSSLVAGCKGFYDRAALIALPAEMRARYVQHMRAILPIGCQGILVTLIYDQAKMDGPPFSVADEEVEHLYSSGWQCRHLRTEDAFNRRFADRGLESLEESVYQLRRC